MHLVKSRLMISTTLLFPIDPDQVGRQDLKVETSLGPVVGEKRWGWDSRFNQ